MNAQSFLPLLWAVQDQSPWITIISLNELILNFNFSLREDQCLHHLMVYSQVIMQLGLNSKKCCSKT